MKYTAILLISSAISLLSCHAQSTNGFQSAGDNDLEYKYIVHGDGERQAQIGDIAFLNLESRIGDSLLINTLTLNDGKPVMQQLQASQTKGDLMEGLLRMKKGDSVVFRILVDTLAARSGQPKPAWAKPGAYFTWAVKMVDLKTKEEMMAAQAAQAKVQQATDDSLLQAYFAEHHITNAKKTESGLYYVMHEAGTGNSPTTGQTVTVNYTGRDLGGEVFDSNTDPAFHHVQPFSFPLGKRSVIPGWDEGVALMKKGGKATFYLPSALAYGERGAGDKIPPNAILIFDIELIDFK